MVRIGELDYDNVRLTEHHVVEDSWIPAVLPWRRRSPCELLYGTFVLWPPLRDPVRVAEYAIAVDILSDGHLDLNVGLRSLPG